jgi:tetratricopeptide (TPR) repeat protein
MSKQDWFRRKTWTDSDKAEFNARLNRSRGAGNKAQYLRIQAGHLAEAGHHTAAIELLDRLLTEFPEQFDLAPAHLQKATSLAELGQVAVAVVEFRRAMQSERDFPTVRTSAWLDFGMFVVERVLTVYFDEALSTLKEFGDHSRLMFPSERYRYCAIRALIAGARGDTTTAGDFAKQALVEAEKAHSGFRYHPTVGLVGTESERLENKLRALAAR